MLLIGVLKINSVYDSNTMVKQKKRANSGKKGIISLPTILMVSGIIAEVALVGVILAFLFSASGFGGRLAAESLAAAQTGIQDAFYRIVINDFASSYTITVGPGNRLARITIERDPADLGICNVGWGCRFRVRSVGEAFLSNSQMEAILGVDPLSREISILSLREIPI